ncbi:matrixin family metalloprotease [Aquimarina aquimarini]|uniref:matrixin family metalloprotease n=1 Tax=Aquimarina aquimarini TaxID=1191734 RepID=UPI000D54B7B2|nr:matrixin family metalloprotease [Aquimarina aquimarini]
MAKTTKPTSYTVSKCIDPIKKIVNQTISTNFINRLSGTKDNSYIDKFIVTCKIVLFILSLPLILSCSTGDELSAVPVEPIFVDSPERIVKIKIIYVESNESGNKSSYDLNEKEFMDYLNGYYFHRLGIGLELESSMNMVNEDLYDLRDNEGSEPRTFFMQSKKSYDQDKINIYIIKRSNIRGIAGIGRDQRVLLTDENLFTSTTPHEIGHALGLFHIHETENIMNSQERDSRHHFNAHQEEKIKKRIDQINLFGKISHTH